MEQEHGHGVHKSKNIPILRPAMQPAVNNFTPLGNIGMKQADGIATDSRLLSLATPRADQQELPELQHRQPHPHGPQW